ncbi:MAG: prepilin-type N-terminal cleavage/methylation domain-containing protein [Shewanella sp.]|nr:prepilin-type N-terminal cleavage/methylation domain-containing protein [Shewanella sp.]
MRRKTGFTLMELLVVFVILGVLAAVAAPRFINLSSEAKVKVLMTVSASVKAANDQLQILSKLPSYRSRPAENRNRADLTEVDMDGDGIFEILLKCGFLDDNEIVKRIDFSDEQLFTENIDYDKLYIGFVEKNIKSSQCYFMYRQSMGETIPTRCDSSDPNFEPTYQVVSTGC